MDDTTPDDLKRDRYANRRRMAWWSFLLIGAVGIPLLVFGLTSDERASRIGDMAMTISTLLGVWTAVITWYFGATTVTDNTELKQ